MSEDEFNEILNLKEIDFINELVQLFYVLLKLYLLQVSMKEKQICSLHLVTSLIFQIFSLQIFMRLEVVCYLLFKQFMEVNGKNFINMHKKII